MEKLNEAWHVFAALALGFLILALLFYRHLLRKESIKADTGSNRQRSNVSDEDNKISKSMHSNVKKRHVQSSSEEDEDPQQAVHRNYS